MTIRRTIQTSVCGRAPGAIGLILMLSLVAAASHMRADPVPAAEVRGASNVAGYVIIGLGRGGRNRLCLAATVEGHKGLMMLDTGASSILLNRDTFSSLLPAADRKLPPHVPAQAPVNDTMSPVGITRDFHIANLNLGAIPVILIDRRSLYDTAMLYAEHSERQYDGLIGENVLRHYNAVIDCGRCGLYLNTDPAHKHDFGSGFARAGWTRVPMSDLSNDFTVPCRINDHEFRIIVDTGAPFTSLDRNLVGSAQLNVQDLPLRGGVIGGRASQVGYVQLTGWQLGGYSAPTTHTTVIENLKGYVSKADQTGGAHPVIGLLGSDFLATNNAIIDVGNHALYLKTGGSR